MTLDPVNLWASVAASAHATADHLDHLVAAGKIDFDSLTVVLGDAVPAETLKHVAGDADAIRRLARDLRRIVANQEPAT